MDGAGEQLLAGPRFSNQQRGSLRMARELGGAGDDGLEGGTVARDALERLYVELVISRDGRFAVPGDRGDQRVSQQLGIVRKGEVVSGAVRNGLGGGAATLVGPDHEDRRPAPALP